MITINGVFCSTQEELEIAIVDLPEQVKEGLRNDFNGVPNSQEQTQEERDLIRYQKRAAARDLILAELAVENMSKVRNGTWTVNQLISLTQDQELKNLLDDINTLSYEIATSKVMSLSNPMITSDVKASWVSKLQKHFYL